MRRAADSVRCGGESVASPIVSVRLVAKDLDMNELWILLFSVGVLFVWLFFFGVGRRKACPDCNEPLPLIQSPFTKTTRQWFEGGHICKACGCETDIAGRKVRAGTRPQTRWVLTGIGLQVLTVIPAIVLLTVLFQG